MDCTALIRTKNSQLTLSSTFMSLVSQQGVELQFLVVDSGSVDGTLAISRGFGAKIVEYHCENGFNYSEALNIGFRHVTTEYVLVVSSHVQFVSPRTVHLLKARLDDGKVVVAFCGHESASEDDVSAVAWEDVSLSTFNGFNGNSNCCAMYRHADWCSLPFDEQVPTAEDLVWVRERLRSRHGSVSSRLVQPGILYGNPNYTRQKVLREFEAVHRFVLKDTHRLLHGIKLLINSVRWAVRGNGADAKKCLLVGRNLMLRSRM